MTFPLIRPRRLRQTASIRKLVRETDLLPHHLIAPIFIKEGITKKQPIESMPGIFQFTLKEAVKEAEEINKKGIGAVLLFGIPNKKNAQASGAYDENGIVQQTVKAIKNKCPDLIVITDVCLCEYMSHGHCGILDAQGCIENDSTLELLARTALSHAQAGADIVAPSDMMDGRIKAIRKKLDENNYNNVILLSYAVKHASAFYGPFRQAAESAPKFGDRKSYQMDFANVKEALKEAKLDEKEGADILMVKPAGSCLDIISKVAEQTNLPVAAYQVSGEYLMISSAAQKGFLDRQAAILESLTAIRRAGARMIITYFAKEIADTL